MIQNEAALRPEYVPRDLYHREGQIKVLSSTLSPLTAGVRADNATIFGPSGSGKTTIAKYVLEQVQEETADFDWGYVSCLSESTKVDVFHRLLTDAGFDVPAQRRGTPAGTYIDRLRDHSRPFVAVLDKADVLADRSILATLYELPDVSWIAIAVDETTFMMDPHPGVESRVRSAQTLLLDRYSVTQLVDNLDARVEAGLWPTKVEDGALERIADRAHGNARDAIKMVRHSAR